LPFGALFDKELKLIRRIEKAAEKGAKLRERRRFGEAKEVLHGALMEAHSEAANISRYRPEFSRAIARLGEEMLYHDNHMAEQCFILALNADPENWPAYLGRAKALYKMGRAEEALKVVEAYLRAQPKSVEGLELKAQICETIGDIDAALQVYYLLTQYKPEEIRYYDAILRHDPHNVAVLIKKGKALYHAGDYHEAISAMRAAAEVDPDKKEVYMFMGAAYEKLENHEDAASAFRRATELDPVDARAWMNYGHVLEKMERYEEAASAYHRAITIDPNDFRAWYRRGRALYRAGKMEEALENLLQALELREDPKVLKLALQVATEMERWNVAATVGKKLLPYATDDDHVRIATALWRAGRGEEALEVIEAGLAKGVNLELLRLKIRILEELGRHRELISAIDAIMNEGVSDADLWVAKARAYRNLNKYKSALECYIKAVEIDPHRIEVLRELRDVARRVGDIDRAIETARRIAELDDGDWENWVALAEGLMIRKRYDEAAEALRKALSINERADVYNKLGICLYRMGEMEDALEAFDRAITLSPDDKKYWKNRGRVLQELGRMEEAAKSYEKALELDESDDDAWHRLAQCCLQLGEWERGLYAVEKALALRDETDYALTKADLLRATGKPEAAAEVLEKLAETRKDHTIHHRLATVYMEMGEHAKALAAIERAISQEKSVEYLRLKKDICKALGDHACVAKTGREIIALDPKDRDTYRDIREALVALGKIESAITLAKREAEIFPEDVQVLRDLKELYRKKQSYADLYSVAKKIAEKEPDDADNYLDMAEALIALKRRENVRELLERAASLGESKRLYVLYGRYYELEGDYERAAKNYEKALKYESVPRLYLKIAECYRRAGLLETALETVERGLEVEETPYLLREKAMILYEMGEYDEALETAQRIEEKDPEIQIAIGHILLAKGDTEGAIENFRAAYEATNSVEALLGLGEAYEKTGELKKAALVYKKAVETEPHSFEALRRLGRVLIALQRFRDAVEMLRRALLIKDDDADVWLNLGTAYEHLGMSEKAMECYEKAAGIDKKNEQAWCMKGLLNKKMGNYKEAERDLKKALKLNPDLTAAKEALKEVREMIKAQKVEEYARKVLVYEYEQRRGISRMEAFKKLKIPLAYLDKTLRYVAEEPYLSLEGLSEEDRKRLEELSKKVVSAIYSQKPELFKEGIRLSDIVALNPDLKVSEAKEVLAYIRAVDEADVPLDLEDPVLEQLASKATDALEDYSIPSLVHGLGIGVYRAKQVAKVLSYLMEDVSTHIPETKISSEEYQRDLEKREKSKKSGGRKKKKVEETEERESEEDEDIYL